MTTHDDPERSLICPACGEAMRVVKIIPKLGGLPQLTTFRCDQCGEVLTAEDDQ